MPTVYPGATDAFTNPTATDAPNSPDHAAQHANINDAAEAIEAIAGRGVLGYVTSVTSQTGITTAVDLTGLSVAVTVAASRRIRISGQLRVLAAAANDMGRIRIKEGVTTHRVHDFIVPAAALGESMTLYFEVIVSPSAAVHTYKLTAEKVVGTSISTTLGATFEGTLMVEDIGSA